MCTRSKKPEPLALVFCYNFTMYSKSTTYDRLLEEVIAFETISTDPSYAKECQKCVAWLEKQFKAKQFKVKILRGKHTNPVVVARYTVDPHCKTVLIYGHYDVQPAREQSGWKSDPFKVVQRGPKLYARGIVDNKGQFVIHMASIFDLIDQGNLGYNVVCMLEGNEESGNEELPKQLKQYSKDLDCDVVLVSDGELLGSYPVLDTGLRGGGNIRIEIQTAPNDFHSGLFGGAVPSASQEAIALVDKIFDDRNPNKILIPGFYSVDTKPSKQLVDSLGASGSDDSVAKQAGVKTLHQHKGHNFFSSTGLLPTLEVSGIHAGYTGVGFQNIVPGYADVRLNLRTVYGQKTKSVVTLVTDFIKKSIPSYVDYHIHVEEHGDPIFLDTDGVYGIRAQTVLERVYKKPVIKKYVGGSIPILADFQNILGKQVISVSLGNDDCAMHGANENFKISLINKGLDFSRIFFSKVEN